MSINIQYYLPYQFENQIGAHSNLYYLNAFIVLCLLIKLIKINNDYVRTVVELLGGVHIVRLLFKLLMTICYCYNQGR